MFTSFKGFDLIDKYQKAKKAKKDNKKSNNAKLVKIFDILLPVFCGIIFLAGVVGFYLCLFLGVAG